MAVDRVEVICDLPKYKAEKVAEEQMGGWKTTHVRITREREVIHRWTTTELEAGVPNIIRSLDPPRPGACTNDLVTEAAWAAGGRGVLVKEVRWEEPFIAGEEPTRRVETVLLRHDARAPDARLFELPTGYREIPPPPPPAPVGAARPPAGAESPRGGAPAGRGAARRNSPPADSKAP